MNLVISAIFLAFLLEPTPAFAYIDPGTLSAFFQSMYVAVFGFFAAWVFKPWQYIKSRLLGRKKSSRGEAEDSHRADEKPRDDI